MVIKVAVCEDEQSIRNGIKTFLNKIGEETKNNIKVTFFSAGEFLLRDYPADYDIVLLDINMGKDNLNGIQTAKNIRKVDDKVILMFLTSTTKYLKQGYEVRAFRYLTKPISYDEFRVEIRTAISEVFKSTGYYLRIMDKSIFHRIDLNDIYYIETWRRKTIIHTISRDVYSTYSMSYLTDLLKDKEFYRCHNSYLVNLIHVDKLEDKALYVNNDIRIPVSRHRVKEIKTLLSQLDDIINSK